MRARGSSRRSSWLFLLCSARPGPPAWWWSRWPGATAERAGLRPWVVLVVRCDVDELPAELGHAAPIVRQAGDAFGRAEAALRQLTQPVSAADTESLSMERAPPGPVALTR